MLQEDATRLDAGERTVMIAQALKELSSDFPRRITRDFTGDGSRAYALVDSTDGDPAESGIFQDDWTRGLSSIRGVYIQDSDSWLQLDPEFWEQTEYKYGTTVEEWLPSLVFSATMDTDATFQVRFSAAWTENDPELGGRLYTATVEVAAAYAHSAIAAGYAAMTDAVLEADSVDQGSLATRHMDLHDLHRRNYRKLIGLQQADGASAQGGGSAPPASLQKDLVDHTTSWGGLSLRRGYNR